MKRRTSKQPTDDGTDKKPYDKELWGRGEIPSCLQNQVREVKGEVKESGKMSEFCFWRCC